MTKRISTKRDESSDALERMIADEAAFTRSVKNIERFVYENASAFARECEPGSLNATFQATLSDALRELDSDVFARVSPETREAGHAAVQAALTSARLNASLDQYWSGVLSAIDSKLVEIDIDHDKRVVTLTKHDSMDSVESQKARLREFVSRATDAGLAAFIVRGAYKLALRYRTNDKTLVEFAYYAGLLRAGGAEFGETSMQELTTDPNGV
jgi:hypothetical protein